ncbi:MAG: cupin domain-containing protein [Woeseiaceae bacterium]|nr:cupin domain-containing protein [Woeseiaceae bacterium]
MKINADFSRRVVIRPADYRWVPSPMPGVERMMLDRIGEEVARATSLVRYAPDSRFSRHVHGGGEEFFVLEGVFADEHAEYPRGTYVRNPIGTAHTPRVGPEGCTIFVKLHQFERDDTTPVVVDTTAAARDASGDTGVETLELHSFGSERVRLLRLAPGAEYRGLAGAGIAEMLVLEGTLTGRSDDCPAGTWIRDPGHGVERIVAGTEGALLFLKTGYPVPLDA